MRSAKCLLPLLIFLAVPARAQYLANYQTNVVSGINSNWTGNYLVGSNTVADVLRIENGGVLSNGFGYVGFSNSHHNAAIVTGAGSVWSNTGPLIVGSWGNSNTMTISNGGRVWDSFGYVGYAEYVSFGSSNHPVGNSVTVTGPGSTWETRADLFVGYNSTGDTLNVRSGAAVLAKDVTLGGDLSVIQIDGGTLCATGSPLSRLDSIGNADRLIINSGEVYSVTAYLYWSQAWVGGSSSLWSNQADFYVEGRSVFVVTNGARVFSGSTGIGTGSSSSTVTVAGANSAWTSSQGLDVGGLRSSNTLNIMNGGAVLAGNINVGATGGTGNLINVSGGLLVASNSTQNGPLDIRRGAVALNSGTIDVQRLVMTNGNAGTFDFHGGTLISGGTMVTNGLPFVVGDGTSIARFVLDGGTHSFADGLDLAVHSVLSGTGTVAATVINYGTLSPGFSPGILAITGNLTQQVNSALSVEIAGLGQGTDYDWLQIIGSGVLDGWLDVALLDAFVPSPDNVFTVVTATASLDGAFDNVTPDQLVYLSTTVGGRDAYFRVNMVDGASDSLILYDFQTVPEPSVAWLMAMGGLIWLARRRARSTSV